jgi:hypothetical protein
LVFRETWRAHKNVKSTRQNFCSTFFDILKYCFWWQDHMHPKSKVNFRKVRKYVNWRLALGIAGCAMRLVDLEFLIGDHLHHSETSARKQIQC